MRILFLLVFLIIGCSSLESIKYQYESNNDLYNETTVRLLLTDDID